MQIKLAYIRKVGKSSAYSRDRQNTACGPDMAHETIFIRSANRCLPIHCIWPDSRLPWHSHGVEPCSLLWGQHILHFHPRLQDGPAPALAGREVAAGGGGAVVVGRGSGIVGGGWGVGGKVGK